MFIGRNRELSLLNDLWVKKHAALVVCKGRRRIGKSTLIQQFGKTADTFLEFQGAVPEKGVSNQKQMEIFVGQLCTQTRLPSFKPESWAQIFSFLSMTIKANQKTVVFLDEISWMAARDSTFAGQLKIAWDTQLKKFPKLILVLCGSVSSWIDRNILNHTGFMGRISLELTPDQLQLHNCNKFWGKRATRISALEKLKVLTVTGGVPRYLEEINPTVSAEDNIKQMCFTKEGILFNEFDRIFSDVFDRRALVYKKIVNELVTGAKTLTEIARDIKFNKGGHISTYLNDLVASGFISSDTIYSIKTGKSLRGKRFRLKDNYMRFYLKYIEPLAKQIKAGTYDNFNIEDLLNWETIMGLQFESLVMGNLPSIINKLGINPSSIQSASPYYQKQTKTQKACQIDLVIRTKYAFYPCEIKFRKKIKPTIINEVSKKLSRLHMPSTISYRPVLIYAGNLSSKLKQEDFFDKVIDFADLLLEERC